MARGLMEAISSDGLRARSRPTSPATTATTHPPHSPPPPPPPSPSMGLRATHRQRAARALCIALGVLLAVRAATLLLPALPHVDPMGAGAAAVMARYPRSAAAYAERVRAAAARNFGAYWAACRGRDEFVPATRTCDDWFRLGLTAVDSLDTLLLMRLERHYQAVRSWAARQMDVRHNYVRASLFELVIRALGGLNSAYALTEDALWVTRAQELGDAILPAFNTTSGCPAGPEVALNSASQIHNVASDGSPMLLSTAEVGTLQLEMRTLSAYTGDRRYAQAADRCINAMLKALPDNRVVPTQLVNDPAANAKLVFNERSRQTIGAHTDSFVEMLLKTWIAGGKRDDALRSAFERQVELIFQELSANNNGTAYIGLNSAPSSVDYRRHPVSSMEHLVCFFPGVLALAALHGLGGGVDGQSTHDYIHRARRLTYTCYLMSRSNAHGLAPEISTILPNGSVIPKGDADHSLLRPEIVEALYVMHSVTGDEVYRDWAKNMWDDMERSATIRGLLSSSFGLKTDILEHKDKLHSFVIAETLKYLFLLFRDAGDGPRIDLKSWVFNTEAHPCGMGKGRSLTVTVLSARGLADRDDGLDLSDPYVLVCFDGWTQHTLGRTTTVVDSLSPEWNESFTVDLSDAMRAHRDLGLAKPAALSFVIRDADQGYDQPLGTASIPLKTLMYSGEVEGEYEINGGTGTLTVRAKVRKAKLSSMAAPAAAGVAAGGLLGFLAGRNSRRRRRERERYGTYHSGGWNGGGVGYGYYDSSSSEEENPFADWWEMDDTSDDEPASNVWVHDVDRWDSDDDDDDDGDWDGDDDDDDDD